MRQISVAAVILLTLGAVAGCSQDRSDVGTPVVRSDAAAPATPPAPSSNRRHSDTSNAAAASCVEAYSPDAVASRAFAFDGVIVSLGRSVSDRGDGADLGLPGVTFEVREWFVGGANGTVTVDMQLPTEELQVGSRLLVSGEARWGGAPLESPIAWGCGFSIAYDSAEASAWRSAVTS